MQSKEKNEFLNCRYELQNIIFTLQVLAVIKSCLRIINISDGEKNKHLDFQSVAFLCALTV